MSGCVRPDHVTVRFGGPFYYSGFNVECGTLFQRGSGIQQQLDSQQSVPATRDLTPFQGLCPDADARSSATTPTTASLPLRTPKVGTGLRRFPARVPERATAPSRASAPGRSSAHRRPATSMGGRGAVRLPPLGLGVDGPGAFGDLGGGGASGPAGDPLLGRADAGTCGGGERPRLGDDAWKGRSAWPAASWKPCARRTDPHARPRPLLREPSARTVAMFPSVVRPVAICRRPAHANGPSP